MSQLQPRDERSRFRDTQDPPHPDHSAEGTAMSIRFTLWWKLPGEDDAKARKETYEKPTRDPVQWSREIIDWFNTTLRPGERKREFVRCEVQGEVPTAEHKWAKATAMSQANRYGSPYDKMFCERCGITGKRFGIGGVVKIDSAFKLKVYQRCDTSAKKLGKWKDKP